MSKFYLSNPGLILSCIHAILPQGLVKAQHQFRIGVEDIVAAYSINSDRKYEGAVTDSRMKM